MEGQDLLIADIEHFGESMWRNEEVGEKRFDFFVTLVTAVLAGLVALATSGDAAAREMLRPTAVWATGALLLIGVLSYLRMVHRNRVTDQYKDTLKYIRSAYRAACPGLASYEVPTNLYSPRQRWQRWFTGGYAETIGTIDGLLFAGALWLTGVSSYLAALLGLGVATVLWLYARRRAR